jgi:hypothetical protein
LSQERGEALGVKDDFSRRWFVSTLSIATAIFFSAALVTSAMTYVSVMDARQEVRLRDAIETTEMLTNGSLAISLTIVLDNPSRQELRMSSISWNVKIFNTSGTSLTYIPLVNVFGVPEGYSVLQSHDTMTLEFEAFVSDVAKLSSLNGYINHSGLQPLNYTQQAIPYVHDFRIVAWIDDFDHDYQYSEEDYLNQLVKIERRYLGGDYL